MDTTPIVAMQKFQFGDKIFCADGEYGTLQQLIFDSSTRSVIQLGVKTRQFFGKIVYTPFSSVEDATGDTVVLRITHDEFETASLAGSPTHCVLEERTTIQNHDNAARGSLRLVAVEPENGKLAYVVAHHLRTGVDTLIRQEFVTRIATDAIEISIPEVALQITPPYHSDRELQQEAERILFQLTPLHVDYEGMQVRVLDSVLYLTGNISSTLRGEIVADQASGVEGLLDVKNYLVGDDKLASDLALTLSRDERTRDVPIGVYPRLGVVRLSGAVHNQDQKQAADQIARSFSGVRAVNNDLVIDPQADILNVMASSMGGEAEDKIPGRYIRHTR